MHRSTTATARSRASSSGQHRARCEGHGDADHRGARHPGDPRRERKHRRGDVGSLTYSWDFGNGGTTKDATGAVVEHVYGNPGTYDATVTVSDAAGLTDTATVRVTITKPGQPTPPMTSPDPTPTTTPTPTTPGTGSGSGSGTGSGGTSEPGIAVMSVIPTALTRALPCQGRSVGHLGSWRVRQGDAPGGSYCDNRGKRSGRDVLRVGFWATR